MLVINTERIQEIKMKITKQRLKEIIKEETDKALDLKGEEPPSFEISDFDDRAAGMAKVHDIIVGAFDQQGIYPEGQIPQPIMKAIQNAGVRVWDAIKAGELEYKHSNRDDDPEPKKKVRDPYAGIGDAYYKSGMYSGD